MPIVATHQEFKFSLSQLVDLNASDEWGEIKGRAQYANGENQYFIYYKAANGCARTSWFDESTLTATEDDRHPGLPVFASSISSVANGEDEKKLDGAGLAQFSFGTLLSTCGCDGQRDMVVTEKFEYDHDSGNVTQKITK